MIDSKLVNGSFPIKVGKHEFKSSRLTDIDRADLDGYIKARYVANAAKAASLLPKVQGDQIIKIAMEEISNPETNIAWGTIEGLSIISTLDGTLHLGYQMCLKRHPRLTFQEFEEAAKSSDEQVLIEAINDIGRAWNHFNPPVEESEESGGSSTENTKSE